MNPAVVAGVLLRASYALWAVSLIYLAIAIHAIRFGERRSRVPGAFPLTALFCFTFLFEAFVRSGVLFAEGNNTLYVFEALRPFFNKAGKDATISSFALFVWKFLVNDETAMQVLFKAATIAFAVFTLVSRVSVGSGADTSGVKKSRWYQVQTLLLVVAFSALCGMSASNCVSVFDQRRIVLEPTAKTAITVAENLHSCVRGPFGLGDALVTIALLHASLAWKSGSWIGIQHVLAFRWSSVVVRMMELFVRGQLVEELLQNKPSMSVKFEVIAVLIQVVAVFLLFFPKFAAKQPLSAMVLLSLLMAAGATASGQVPISRDMLAAAYLGLGELFVLFTVVAVFLTGGIGISFFMFTVVGSAQVHAPWLRNLPMFNMAD